MSEAQGTGKLRALAADLDEAIAGCDEIERLLGEILDRPTNADQKEA